ncbi:MFS transporter [Desulfobacterales bacterium HSG2]|nr:MFS transporter [Desulfobacterales bacterium HSG2]
MSGENKAKSHSVSAESSPPSGNQRPSQGEPANGFGLGWQLGVTTLNRFFISTARRFAYPFAPALSRGLGVSTEAVTLVIVANHIAGVMSLMFGPLGDRRGYRMMMLSGLALFAAGMLIGGFFASYWSVIVALFLAGVANSLFSPATLAYIGERVPYHRRGLAIGISEMSWAGSSLIGIPLIGVLIDRMDWSAPFFVLGGLGLLGMVSIAVLIPEDRRDSAFFRERLKFRDAWRLLIRERIALGGLGFAFFSVTAIDTFFVIYGIWMEETFHLSIMTLGMTATVIGIAELSGEGLTAFLSDRLGKRRSVIIGLVLSGMSYILLPLAGGHLLLALSALFAVFLFFEFMIVTALSVMTEVLPRVRATMMSGYLTAASLGHVFGALLGIWVWNIGGIWAVAIASALISSLGLISMLWGIKRVK